MTYRSVVVITSAYNFFGEVETDIRRRLATHDTFLIPQIPVSPVPFCNRRVAQPDDPARKSGLLEEIGRQGWYGNKTE